MYLGEEDVNIADWFMMYLPPQPVHPPREAAPDRKPNIDKDYTHESSSSDMDVDGVGGVTIPKTPSGGADANATGFKDPLQVMLPKSVNGVIPMDVDKLSEVPMDLDTVFLPKVVAGGLSALAADSRRRRSRDNRSSSPIRQSPTGYRERSPLRQRSSGL